MSILFTGHVFKLSIIADLVNLQALPCVQNFEYDFLGAVVSTDGLRIFLVIFPCDYIKFWIPFGNQQLYSDKSAAPSKKSNIWAIKGCICMLYCSYTFFSPAFLGPIMSHNATLIVV